MATARPLWLNRYGEPARLAAGTTILNRGEWPRFVFYLDDGIARVERPRARGQSRLVGLRFSGWFLGAEAAMTGKVNPLSCTAVTECQVHRFPQHAFVHLLQTDPDLSARILQAQSRERFSDAQRGLRCQLQPHERLADLLLQLATANPTTTLRREIVLGAPVDTRLLAELVGVSVPRVESLLRELERGRSIDRRGGALAVIDERRLRAESPIDVGWPIEGCAGDDLTPRLKRKR